MPNALIRRDDCPSLEPRLFVLVNPYNGEFVAGFSCWRFMFTLHPGLDPFQFRIIPFENGKPDWQQWNPITRKWGD